MVAKLSIEEGPLKGLVFSLDKGHVWVIGRDPEESQLVIEDPLVDRKQLLIRQTPEGMFIENLSLIYSIQINGEEIGDQPHLLQHGDTLKVGSELLRYSADDSAEPPPSDLSFPEEEEIIPSDTILDEGEMELAPLAEIDFGLAEAGRWLLKVIGGPNHGAEFYMQAGHTYTLGTDPHSCDIVFHDTSVSRQHARITVTPEDTLFIEDLKSRNGVLVEGIPIEKRQELSPNVIVTLGTTLFVIYDREGEMQTIISPLLPSIVKVLQQRELPKAEAAEGAPTALAEEPAAAPTEIPKPEVLEAPPAKPKYRFGPMIFFLFIIGLFAVAGIGAMALFEAKPVIVNTYENANELIENEIRPFPAVRFTFNKASGKLFLSGHVATLDEKSQLLYRLNGLKFIKTIDDSSVVIDEYVWHEVNSILAEHWKGITVHSPSAGHFTLSGYLKTHQQAEELSNYMSLNFPYLNLLKINVVVEEDVIHQINILLRDAGFGEVVSQMTSNGEVSLTGSIPNDKVNEMPPLITKIKQIPGVRAVHNLTRTQTLEMGIKDISDFYEVTGQSRMGDKYTVVINGRVLSEGDELDNMTITKIIPNTVFLEQEGIKYRIDY